MLGVLVFLHPEIEHPITFESPVDKQGLLYFIQDIELLILEAGILEYVEAPRVDCPDVHIRETELIPDLLARKLQHPRLELRSGLVGIGKGDYLSRLSLARENEINDSLRDDLSLAGTGAGDYLKVFV
jgi:hypothetical protein